MGGKVPSGMGFDPYREEGGPARFDLAVAAVVLVVVIALLVWAFFF